jgi:hypothetical protein
VITTYSHSQPDPDREPPYQRPDTLAAALALLDSERSRVESERKRASQAERRVAELEVERDRLRSLLERIGEVARGA